MPPFNAPIILGCDHAAVELKNQIKDFLETQGIAVTDVGTQGPGSVDYPDFGHQVACRVAKGEFQRGILLCGTGIGMSMAANRHRGVRAALCHDLFAAKMSRLHNDANLLVLGGRVVGDVLACEIVRTFLETPFEGGRHQQRIDKLDQISESC
ncbi:MAG: ribose 5-phosphate isomerase B [Desulfobacterales bacterium]|jgi:ribose 5-phosphate isomerase B